MTEKAISDITARYNKRNEAMSDRTDSYSYMYNSGWLAGAEYILQKAGIDFDFDNDGNIVIK